MLGTAWEQHQSEAVSNCIVHCLSFLGFVPLSLFTFTIFFSTIKEFLSPYVGFVSIPYI